MTVRTEQRQVLEAMIVVDSVAVLTSPTGKDVGLRISHGEGQTLLTFPSGP